MPRPHVSRAGTRAPAFTLIELLVVIAVLAALAAVLLPVFARARERAGEATCLARMRQIAAAHQLYLQDYDERFLGWWQYGPSRPYPYGLRSFWTEALRPYTRGEALFRDPLAAAEAATGPRLADYSLVTWGPDGRGTPERPRWRWPGPPLALGMVSRPVETIALTDGWTEIEDTRSLVARHRGRVHVTFLDGHAAALTRGQIYTVARDAAGSRAGEYWYRYMSADR